MEENNQRSISESNGPSPMNEAFGYKHGLAESGKSSSSGGANPGNGVFKRYLTLGWEILKILIIAVVIVLPIRYFLFQPFIVKGDSMVPNFHSGDYLIVDEISYELGNPQRGDVVVFKTNFIPQSTGQRFIKRVIGLPGETVDIKNGVATIIKDGKTLTLQETYLPNFPITASVTHVVLGKSDYFVMGDNRPFSFDSRSWGILPREYIVGRALIRIFPFNNISYISDPVY